MDPSAPAPDYWETISRYAKDARWLLVQGEDGETLYLAERDDDNPTPGGPTP